MKLKISRLVKEQMKKPSPIRQIMKMTEKQNMINMGLNPEEVISFGGGWVNHLSPPLLAEKYIEICSDAEKFHRSGAYSATAGETRCREALALFEREIFGMDLEAKNVIVGHSSTQITHDLFLSLLDHGDKVLLLDPTYANYQGQIEFVGSKVVRLKVLDGKTWEYLPDVDKTIEEFQKTCRKQKPKLVLFPSPDNPTSQIPPNELVKAMLDITEEKGIYLAVDHAYKTQYFSEKPPEYFSFSPKDHGNLIAIHSLSKWLRSLGRRLGWLEASEEIVEAMERVQQCSILCPDTMHQLALSSYIHDSLHDGSLKMYIDEVRAQYAKAAVATVEAINDNLGLPCLEPQGGLYTVMKVFKDSNRFVEDVLKHTGVLFIPGAGFGPSLKQGVRISYGPLVNDLEKIEIAMERVGKYLSGKSKGKSGKSGRKHGKK